VSPTPSCNSLRRVAGALACAATLLTLGGCHRTASNPREPVPVARPFPGVDLVTTRSGGFMVRIQSGLVGRGEPLYVIDGAPMWVEPHRGIDWFKPEDIEQISVLKTPTETAVYGAQGVNGVVLITTRNRARGRS